MNKAKIIKMSEIKIWQLNVNRSKTAQEEMLATPDINNYDIIALQEPFFYSHVKLTKADHKWTVIYPSSWMNNDSRVRSVLLINCRISDEALASISFTSNNVTGIQLQTDIGLIRIVNLYVGQNNNNSLEALENHLISSRRGCYTRVERTKGGRQRIVDEEDDLERMQRLGSSVTTINEEVLYIWLGDLNCHHPLWDEERNRHLFSAANLEKSQKLLDLLASHNMRMILPKDIPTLEAKNSKNTTRPDNIFASSELVNWVISCSACPELRPPFTDHFPILTSLATQIDSTQPAPRRNWKKTNWNNFHNDLKERLTNIDPNRPLDSTVNLNQQTQYLEDAIHASISAIVPLLRPSKYMKKWWNEEIAQGRKDSRKLYRQTQQFRTIPNHPIHEKYRKHRNQYGEMIRKAQLQTWLDWLEDMDETTIWKTSQLLSSPGTDGSRTRIPNLIRTNPDGTRSTIQDQKDKALLLKDTFFPPCFDPPIPEQEKVYPEAAFAFSHITDEQISCAIKRLKPYKAVGQDDFPNALLKECADLLIPYLGPIFRATFTLRTLPPQWKVSTVVTLHKPGRSDYSLPNAYRPITLGKTLIKLVDSCITETLLHHSEHNNILATEQYGGRYGRSTTDALHRAINFIKKAWRRKMVVSALFLDVKGAFPSVNVDRLEHIMRTRGIPEEYTSWIRRMHDG